MATTPVKAIEAYKASMSTHNTREDFAKLAHSVKYRIEQQKTPNEEGANKALQILIDTHHQELQKARQDWLREEIVKLEGMKVCTDAGRADPSYYHCENTRDGTLQTIIDRYQSELDQPTV